MLEVLLVWMFFQNHIKTSTLSTESLVWKLVKIRNLLQLLLHQLLVFHQQEELLQSQELVTQSHLKITLIVTGKTVDVGSFSYDRTTGIGTVTTNTAHGYNATDKFVLSGALDTVTSLPIPLYTNSFIVQDVASLTQFTTKIGVGTTTPGFTGTLRLYRPAFAPTGGNITAENDQTSGRNVPQYAGITTTLSSAVVNRTIDEINVTNLDTNNILIGDYLQIDNEIVRVKETVGANPVKVFRGVLGTIRQTHLNGAIIRRIKPRPIEFRRNSLMRGLLVIHLNILVTVLVTILLHFQVDRPLH